MGAIMYYSIILLVAYSFVSCEAQAVQNVVNGTGNQNNIQEPPQAVQAPYQPQNVPTSSINTAPTAGSNPVFIPSVNIPSVNFPAINIPQIIIPGLQPVVIPGFPNFQSGFPFTGPVFQAPVVGSPIQQPPVNGQQTVLPPTQPIPVAQQTCVGSACNQNNVARKKRAIVADIQAMIEGEQHTEKIRRKQEIVSEILGRSSDKEEDIKLANRRTRREILSSILERKLA